MAEYTMPEDWCAECAGRCRHPVESGIVHYTDCDEDEPNGEWISSHEHQSDAREAASACAHERGICSPDKVVVAYDDSKDGDGEHHVYIVT